MTVEVQTGTRYRVAMDVDYDDPTVPCIVCGAAVPEATKVCPGDPFLGSMSKCETTAFIRGDHSRLSRGKS